MPRAGRSARSTTPVSSCVTIRGCRETLRRAARRPDALRPAGPRRGIGHGLQHRPGSDLRRLDGVRLRADRSAVVLRVPREGAHEAKARLAGLTAAARQPESVTVLSTVVDAGLRKEALRTTMRNIRVTLCTRRRRAAVRGEKRISTVLRPPFVVTRIAFATTNNGGAPAGSPMAAGSVMPRR